MISMSAGCRFSVAVFFAVAPAIALAADLPPQSPPPPSAPAAYTPPAPDWIVTIGLEGRMDPAWAGAPSGKYGFTGFPLVSIRQAGTPPAFFGPRDSFGFPLLDLGQFKVGPAVKIVWQRKASDYTQLNGLGDVKYAIQAGGYAEFWPVPWLRLRGEVRQGFGGETGVTGDAFLDAVVPIGPLTLSGGPRATLQSASAINPYFGITATQSLNSGVAGLPSLPVYNANGGLYSYGAGAQAQYAFSPQWTTLAFVEYERLTDGAANSPLVTQRGSPDQLTFGLGATYSFNMRPWW
jgi:MipA family protein